MAKPNGQASDESRVTGDETHVDETIGTTGTASEGDEQAVQTSGDAPVADEDESFFDPNNLSPELQPAYKQMQAAFTKKTQAIAADRDKVELVNQFLSDPEAALKQLARQYGYSISAPGKSPDQADGKFNPQSWDDVFKEAKRQAKAEIMQDLGPVFNDIRTTRKESVERRLANIDPNWNLYEDAMKANLGKHPTLASDPESLYRMSVPAKVLESRAAQAALKKLKDKGAAAQISTGSTTTKKPSDEPSGNLTFAQAVEFAKKKLAAEASA